LHEISGIIVIDKPEDLTSADITNRLKRIEGVRKTGHTGTLDPFASGVLVCTINQATRLSRFFLDSQKTYEALMVLGTETDTQDATGKILKTAPYNHISENTVKEVFTGFKGQIHQIPPAFSALKHKGIPLYKYARKGTPVIKPARQVSISSITITHMALPDIGFEVTCSSGTYIRTICADIGKELGCGGHLKQLRRIESGGFSIYEAIPVSVVEKLNSIDMLRTHIVPMSDALKGMKTYTVGSNLIEKIKYGKPITREDILIEPGDRGSFIQLIDESRKLLAVVKKSENLVDYNYCCVFVNP
jgi:tRNA pseudouridine55 synthase